MYRSKLIDILKSFSKSELREFGRFLNSPFSGCKKFVLQFYKELIKFYPGFTDKSLLKEKIFAKLYGKRKYNEALVRRMASDLIRHSETYLSIRNFLKNDALRSRCLLNELRIRNLEDQFKVRSEKSLKKIRSIDFVDPELLLEEYFTNIEVTAFRNSLRDSKMHESYHKAMEALLIFFLRSVYSYISHVNTFSFEYKNDDSLAVLLMSKLDNANFLKALERAGGKHSDYLRMIIYVHNILSNKDDTKTYYKLINLLELKEEYFTKWELKNIYVSIIKFYAHHNERSSGTFLREAYNAYNKLLEELLLPDESSKLQLSFCRNYINICIRVGETELINRFQIKYRNNFPAEHRDDLINLCLGTYLFEKGDFIKSLKHASSVNIARDIFKIDIKVLKIKLYYEMGYYDSVNSETDNLKHFLSSADNVKPDSIAKAGNFARAVIRLMKLIQKADTGGLFVLSKQINDDFKISERKWLLEKIESSLKNVKF